MENARKTRKTETIAKHKGLTMFPLESAGVYGAAFNSHDALAMIEYLRDNVVPILGMDVWERTDNGLEIIPPGFDCDRERDESLMNYADRSCTLAESYIRLYDDQQYKDVLFEIIADEDWIKL